MHLLLRLQPHTAVTAHWIVFICKCIRCSRIHLLWKKERLPVYLGLWVHPSGSGQSQRRKEESESYVRLHDANSTSGVRLGIINVRRAAKENVRRVDMQEEGTSSALSYGFIYLRSVFRAYTSSIC